MSDYERKLFINNIRFNAIGVSYLWGGQSPETGFDCSGLVLWAFNMIGWRLHDMTAAQIYEHFKNKEIAQNLSREGCLWFYGDDLTKISHVMIVFKKWEDEIFVLVGSRGGDKNTINNKKAFQQNAFVDVVLSNYWKDKFQIAVDPFQYE